jgi:hypothetical protein
LNSSPLFTITDPLIHQIGLSLKSELEADSPFGSLYWESLGVALTAHLLKHYSVRQAEISIVRAGNISRVDVADFMLRESAEMRYSKQTPLLT